jgi:hypothetical protein
MHVIPPLPAFSTVVSCPIRIIIILSCQYIAPNFARGALHPQPVVARWGTESIAEVGHVQDKVEEQKRKLLVQELETAAYMHV